MPWKVDLRTHEDGRLSDRSFPETAKRAEAEFRILLRRKRLIGKPVAARLVSPATGRAIYFSRFDREIGEGRIHPDAPLDLTRMDDGTSEATLWRPEAVSPEEAARILKEIDDAMLAADEAFQDALVAAYGDRADEYRHRSDIDEPEALAAAKAYKKACSAYRKAEKRLAKHIRG